MATWNICLCFTLCLVLYICDVQAAGHCPDGRDPISGVYCGRGGTGCPDQTYCNIAPNDAYAECCPTHCGDSAPLLDTSGKPLHCGRGGVRCPESYACRIAPNDAWAVCCSTI